MFQTLAEAYPEEETIFGPCLLVPHNAFKTEWNEQLIKEGVKVFQQSYNGKMFFFLKKPSNTTEDQNRNRNRNRNWNRNWNHVKAEAETPQLKPMEWTPENLELVQKWKSEGLGYRRIAMKLRELGYNVCHSTIAKKLGLFETDKVKAPAPKVNCNFVKGENDLLAEYIEALRLLYPKHKAVCMFLVQNAPALLNSDEK